MPGMAGMLDVRGGSAEGGCVGSEEEDGVEEKRRVMHSWMCASRTFSPGGISVPQTGHSSSSRTSLRGRTCGAGGGGTGCGIWPGGICGKDALLPLWV